MKNFSRDLTKVFSAGCVGGLANSLAVWLFGLIGITAALGVSIAPTLSAGWLYPRLIWGGIWGVVFLLPLLKGKSPLIRGLVLSLAPSLVMLFVVFPLKAGKGMMGLDLGTLTPLFVLIFNGAWGVAAAYWLEYIKE